MKHKPKINIANPQRGDEPGTWAHKTISIRFKRIALNIVKENNFSTKIISRLQELVVDIPNGVIRHLDDLGAPDISEWQEYLSPYLGFDWFEPPWFFTEHYFYRRILEATQYFQPGYEFGKDPFHYQKHLGLELSKIPTLKLVKLVSSWTSREWVSTNIIANLLYLDLWGNQADLSLWPADERNKPNHLDHHLAMSYILDDDARVVADRILSNAPIDRIDILIDNAGFELIGDLILVDFLVKKNLASSIVLHVKKHPTYVSDAMDINVRESIDFLLTSDDDEVRAVGERTSRYLSSDRLQIKENWFWTSPLDGWDMPSALRDELNKSSLVISKGDAHYRRLLGDRHWPFTTPFKDILAYYPAPLVTLRTLKSELVVGLTNDQVNETAVKESEWLINGRWGVIQYYQA